MVLPLLFAALLLLPALHQHTLYEHDHTGNLHQHDVIHADFLAVSGHGHYDGQHEHVVLGHSLPASFSQSNLVAFLRHSTDFLLANTEKSPDFFLVDVPIAHAQPGIFWHILRVEDPPPLQQLFPVPNAPRSPPTFA
jgi:hypothetical protein